MPGSSGTDGTDLFGTYDLGGGRRGAISAPSKNVIDGAPTVADEPDRWADNKPASN